jgi:hypothetical protein
VSEVGDVFVSFFKQLLGTSRTTSPFDESFVRCGPCIDFTLHASLLVDVSNDDIKKALFNIGDTKSPGPDAYYALFFKNSWDVVSQDVCAAVRLLRAFLKSILIRHLGDVLFLSY